MFSQIAQAAFVQPCWAACLGVPVQVNSALQRYSGSNSSMATQAVYTPQHCTAWHRTDCTSLPLHCIALHDMACSSHTSGYSAVAAGMHVRDLSNVWPRHRVKHQAGHHASIKLARSWHEAGIKLASRAEDRPSAVRGSRQSCRPWWDPQA